jgi:hypothetical protein
MQKTHPVEIDAHSAHHPPPHRRPLHHAALDRTLAPATRRSACPRGRGVPVAAPASRRGGATAGASVATAVAAAAAAAGRRDQPHQPLRHQLALAQRPKRDVAVG